MFKMSKSSRVSTLVAMAALCGCASNSGVIPAGTGTFNITKQAATGFPGIGNLKAEVYQEAAAHCARDKRDFAVVAYEETQPPFIFGKYPRVDLTFKCV